MRRTIACATLLLATATLAAQPPGLPNPDPKQVGSSARGTDYKRLLAARAVQKDLKLTDDQAKTVVEFGLDVSKQYLEATRDLSKLIPTAKDRIAKRAEFREKFDKDYYDGLAKQLKPEQLKRLGEIRLQAEAPASLAWPAADEKLKLTTDQKTRLTKITRDLIADRLNVMSKELPDVGTDPEKHAALEKKLNDLATKATADALGLLDDAQKKAWKELTGEPFDVSKIGLGAIGKD